MAPPVQVTTTSVTPAFGKAQVGLLNSRHCQEYTAQQSHQKEKKKVVPKPFLWLRASVTPRDAHTYMQAK